MIEMPSVKQRARTVRSSKTLREILRKVPDGDAVVYFTATWCSPCRIFGPVLAKVAARMKVPLIKVDVDRVDPALVSRRPWRVRGLPAVFAYRNRRLRRRLVGAAREAALEDWFRAAFPKEDV